MPLAREEIETVSVPGGSGPVRDAAAEHGLASLLVVALLWAAWRFRAGYLPPPFYDRPVEPLMDLYATLWWAHRHGIYDIWHSIYPPLSFVFLRLTSLAACYGGNAYQARDCDWLARSMLTGFFLINVGLVWRAYRAVDPATAIPRALAVGLGLPMLYALDRGNLLIVCFTAFILGVGPVLRAPAGRWLAMAVAINFKPYLIVAGLAYLARRDWRWLIGVGAAGLAVYLATYAVQRDGSPVQLLHDMGGYAGGKAAAPWENLYYATSYWPLVRLLNAGWGAPVGLPGPFLAGILVGAMRLAQLGGAACLIGAALRPDSVDTRRFMALCAAIAFTTITNGSSGYAQMFLFFPLFFEPWRGPTRITVLTCAWLCCIPFDVVLWPSAPQLARAWWTGREVVTTFGVSAGQLIRPGLLLAIEFGLVALNLQDSWRARRGAGGSIPTQSTAPLLEQRG